MFAYESIFVCNALNELYVFNTDERNGFHESFLCIQKFNIESNVQIHET